MFAATTRHNYTSGVKLARWHMWHTFERWVCWCTFTSGLFLVIHICPCLFSVNKLTSLSRRLQTASSLWISIMWRAKIRLALQNGKKSKDLYFQQLKYWNWICSYSVLEVHYFVIILHCNWQFPWVPITPQLTKREFFVDGISMWRYLWVTIISSACHLSWEVEAIGTKTMALTTMSLSSFHRRRRYESELFGDHIGYKKNNLLWLEDIPLWSFLLTVTVWCLWLLSSCFAS